MKKIVITTFSLFYLLAGIGVADGQRYCQTMQTMMQGDYNSCCCDEPEHSSTACPAANEPATPPGCSDPSIPTSDKNMGMTFHGDCCDVQHHYNQLDTSLLPMNIDVNQPADKVVDALFIRVEKEQYFDELDLQNLSDPSTHLNLPLLI